jgi:hypothetical protein
VEVDRRYRVWKQECRWTMIKKVARNKGRTSVRMKKETKKTIEKKTKLKMNSTITNCNEQSPF